MKQSYFLILLLLLACEKTKENELINFIKTQAPAVDIRTKKVCLIIPSLGCQGCITDAEIFITRNLGKFKRSLLVILTNYQSEKMLKVRLGDTLFRNQELILDKQKVMCGIGKVGFYPKVYYLQNGKIIHTEEVSPENPRNIYADLLKFIENKPR